jgi:hypothetical protein
MTGCCYASLRQGRRVVALLVLTCGSPVPVAASLDVVEQVTPVSVAAPPWPCRLVVASDLRPSIDVAWQRSPTFRAQCERLARAGALVLLHRATVVQTKRQAHSEIGVSADGVTVARVLVRLNAETVELIAHELEHVLEHLDGVNLVAKADRHRSGVLLSGDAYETDRAIEAGQRVAREVRDSVRTMR